MIYRRRIDPDGQDSLARLARWVRPGATVLELGAAAGYFTEHLASLGCTVDVVEVDPAAAGEAARFARRTVVADLDGGAWVAELGGSRYEVIVCADVLEHLRDGAALLRRLRPLVADAGELLLSVPNVAHSAVIARLLDEHFDYGGEGLLDPTHLRLYTWRSLAAVLHEAGYGVEAWDATLLSPFETEFRVRTESLSTPVRDVLERRPHAFVYQWLVRARPGTSGKAPAPGPTGAEATVPVRLLYAETAAGLSLDRALVAQLPLGGARVTLDWPLPEGQGALRWLLADRPGIVEIHALAVHAGAATLWSFDGDVARVATSGGVVRIDDRSYALTGADAWIAPAEDASMLARADRATATLAWSVGIAEAGSHAVLAALAGAMETARVAADARHDELARRFAELESRSATERERLAHSLSRLEEAQATLSRTREALAQRDRDFAELEHAVAAYRSEVERLERDNRYRQSVRWWLRLPFVRARLAWRSLFGP